MQAGVAQLVEYELPKLGVAGSNPVARSNRPSPAPTSGPLWRMAWESLARRTTSPGALPAPRSRHPRQPRPRRGARRRLRRRRLPLRDRRQDADQGRHHGVRDVVVEGVVEGTIRITADLRVGPGGVVKATVSAQSVLWRRDRGRLPRVPARRDPGDRPADRQHPRPPCRHRRGRDLPRQQRHVPRSGRREGVEVGVSGTFGNYIDGQWTPAASGDGLREPQPRRLLRPRRQLRGLGAGGRSCRRSRPPARRFRSGRPFPPPSGPRSSSGPARSCSAARRTSRAMTREMGKVLDETRGDVQEGIDMAFYVAGEGRRSSASPRRARCPTSGRCRCASRWASSGSSRPGTSRSRSRPGRSCRPWSRQHRGLQAGDRHAAGLALREDPRGGRPADGRAEPGLRQRLEGGQPAGERTRASGRLVHRLDRGGPGSQPAARRLGKRLSPRDGRQERHHRHGRRATWRWRPRAILWSAFGTTGQRCTACSRVLVHERVHDELVQRAWRRAPARSGSATGSTRRPRWGRWSTVARSSACESYVKIGSRRGRDAGRGRRAGHRRGAARRGTSSRPTVFADVKPDVRIAVEEIFGPVLSVVKVKDFARGRGRVNNASSYGLSAVHLHPRREPRLRRHARPRHRHRLREPRHDRGRDPPAVRRHARHGQRPPRGRRTPCSTRSPSGRASTWTSAASCSAPRSTETGIIVHDKMPATPLDDRSKEVLRALIQLHVDTGEPVGSENLCRALRRALSPATLRSIMADLERSATSTTRTRAPGESRPTRATGSTSTAWRAPGLFCRARRSTSRASCAPPTPRPSGRWSARRTCSRGSAATSASSSPPTSPGPASATWTSCRSATRASWWSWSPPPASSPTR